MGKSSGLVKFLATGLGRCIPDKIYLDIRFRKEFKRRIDWKDPKTFNEKLQWLKVYDRKPIYTTMVDKFEVKQYVAGLIGEEYIIPTLGVWDSVEDIDFDALPEQFVLKCTHDSGGLVICPDKSKLDVDAAKKKLAKSLKQNFFWSGREWPYKNVKPRIIAEKYMVDESGVELKDYKVVCFGGEPKLIQIHKGRFEHHTQDFYDVRWNKQTFTQGCPLSDVVLDKPVFLDQMLELSRKLSAEIPQVRVDWYCVNGQLYFGETTFFDGSGFCAFEPEQWDYELGSWIELH